jgi:AAA domain/Domain of unknown function (DUF3854)
MTICDLHKRDLAASGLNQDSIAAAGLRCANQAEVKNILGFDTRCGGLVITYPGTNGTRATAFTRVKPDHPFLDRYGKPSKYLSPKGAGNRLYIPPGVETVLSEHNTPLWITEGEKKSLKAAQEGLNCIAVPGVWSWRQRSTSTRSVPIPDLDLITWKGRTAFLVFDSDLRANRQVATALYELSRELERRGAKVSKIDLPDVPGGAKVGLDDYLLSHSIESLCAIDPSPVLPPEFAYIEITPMADFIKKTLPVRDPIISGGILYPSGKLGTTGPGKSLKTMLTQNMTLSLSAGVDFLGFRIPKPRRVLYVQSEVSPYAIQERLKRMIDGRPGLNFADALLTNAHNLKIDTKEGFRTIQHLIERSRAEVLIFDPLYRLHTKDENKAHEMREIVDLFERLIDTFGIALGAVHHHGKGIEGKDDGQLARGSTIFGDWVDSQIVIRGTTEGRYQKRLSFVLRNDAEPEPMQIILDPETLWFRPATVEEANSEKQSEAKKALEAAQSIFKLGNEVTADSMKLALGVSLNTAKSRMRMLERFGWKAERGKFGRLVYRPEGCQSPTFDTIDTR